MIDGLSITPNWVTPGQEATLIDLIGGGGKRVPTTSRNRIERHGPGVAASGYTEAHHTERQIAPHLQDLADRLATAGELVPDAITIGWYLPGQFMRAHVDGPKAGEVIAILGLGGDATMRLRKIDDGPEPRTAWFVFAKRALVVLRGEARWHWTHEILPVAELRISVVFRRATSS